MTPLSEMFLNAMPQSYPEPQPFLRVAENAPPGYTGFITAGNKPQVSYRGVNPSLLDKINLAGGGLRNPMQITSARDSVHRGPQHPAGEAVDIRTHNLSPEEQATTIARLRAQGLNVLLEKDHIHAALPTSGEGGQFARLGSPAMAPTAGSVIDAQGNGQKEDYRSVLGAAEPPDGGSDEVSQSNQGVSSFGQNATTPYGRSMLTGDIGRDMSPVSLDYTSAGMSPGDLAARYNNPQTKLSRRLNTPLADLFTVKTIGSAGAAPKGYV